MTPLQVEKMIRDEFNKLGSTKAKKSILSLCKGGAKHEYDIYEDKKVIGGVSTSPWFNKPKGGKKPTPNTSGQDRAATELLWLSLWAGTERRVHILTDKEMANRLFKKFSGANFQKNIEIHHFNINIKKFSHIGTL